MGGGCGWVVGRRGLREVYVVYMYVGWRCMWCTCTWGGVVCALHHHAPYSLHHHHRGAREEKAPHLLQQKASACQKGGKHTGITRSRCSSQAGATSSGMSSMCILFSFHHEYTTKLSLFPCLLTTNLSLFPYLLTTHAGGGSKAQS